MGRPVTSSLINPPGSVPFSVKFPCRCCLYSDCRTTRRPVTISGYAIQSGRQSLALVHSI
jgi:hypothetical protein